MTLMEICLLAHHESALRGNCSHHAMGLAAFGSGDYFKAMAAGLLTLGGLHAPLFHTYDLLAATDGLHRVRVALAAKRRVPGWGNHFAKTGIDPIWAECDARLRADHPMIADRIQAITEILHEAGKIVYPNPSCYTAATALAMSIPRNAIGEILIRGRLGAWTSEYVRIAQEAPALA